MPDESPLGKKRKHQTREISDWMPTLFSLYPVAFPLPRQTSYIMIRQVFKAPLSLARGRIRGHLSLLYRILVSEKNA